jgi:hypothetical protein
MFLIFTWKNEQLTASSSFYLKGWLTAGNATLPEDVNS